MRTHLEYADWQLWARAASTRTIVAARNLVAARFEPVRRLRRPDAVVDLTFASDGRFAVVPLVFVDVVALARPADDPLVWPSAIADAIDEATAESIADRVVSWLGERRAADALDRESLLFLTEDTTLRAHYDAARERDLVGAAPIARAYPRAVAAAFAARFAAGRRIGIAGAQLEAAAAVLARDASAVVVAPTADAALLDAWYPPLERSPDYARAGTVISQTESGVRIVAESGFERTLAIETTFALDGFPAVTMSPSAACALEVHAAPRPLRASGIPPFPAAIGGSAGRIVLLVAEHEMRMRSPLAESARVLGHLLDREGFTVSVAPPGDDLSDADLVHAFGIERDRATIEALERARAHGVRTIATLGCDDPAEEAAWGADASRSIAFLGDDEQGTRAMLEAFRERRLVVGPQMPAERAGPFAAYDEVLTRALRALDGIVAETAVVAERARTAGARLVNVAAPFLAPDAPDAAIATLVGTTPFVLVRGPIDGAMNLAVLASAAGRSRLPFVVAGPVVDAAVADRLRALAPASLLILPAPSLAEEAALFTAAAVYLDVGWNHRGTGSVLRALCAETEVVVSHRSPAAAMNGTTGVDPADAQAVANAVKDAYYRASAPRPERAIAAAAARGAIDPARNLRAVVATYSASTVEAPSRR